MTLIQFTCLKRYELVHHPIPLKPGHRVSSKYIHIGPESEHISSPLIFIAIISSMEQQKNNE